MNVKHLLATALGAALIAGPVLGTEHSAEHKPLAKMTCEDFLNVEDVFQPRVVYWAVAYAKGGEPEAAVVDIEDTETLIPVIAEECDKTPKESFWEKLKAEMKKLEKKL